MRRTGTPVGSTRSSLATCSASPRRVARKRRAARIAAAPTGKVHTMALPRELEVRRGRRVVRLSHLDRLWWPDEGIRKADVVDYYRAVAPAILPHLRDRPFTFKRHYTGPRSPFEWVKDLPPEAPDWLPVAPLPARSRGGEPVRYALLNDELALLWAVEYGAVDLHVWTSRADRPERPDYVLFDLDPAGVDFGDVVRAAKLLHDALATLGLASVVKTTG